MNLPYEKPLDRPGRERVKDKKNQLRNGLKPYHIPWQNKTFAASLLYVTFFFIFSS